MVIYVVNLNLIISNNKSFKLKTIRFFANLEKYHYLCTQNSNRNGSNIQRGISGEALY